METQKTPNSQSNLEEEEGAEGSRLPDFRLYCKDVVIKQCGTGTKEDRSVEQDRDPRNKPMHLWSPYF